MPLPQDQIEGQSQHALEVTVQNVLMYEKDFLVNYGWDCF